jgi:hypothetical protein
MFLLLLLMMVVNVRIVVGAGISDGGRDFRSLGRGTPCAVQKTVGRSTKMDLIVVTHCGSLST